ncbi:hypothetical protein L227DRAFT_602954 [Lentinus tigrinus ALCF2SS1-6]|uniref:Uncharacterized protein n=1 Tax=Lentinus tigrinus ALCF2SS1-6 TaxID=1328759 RepID=A0A5C2RZM1_9APHY|nr:hypothetical protein L227DRAFT_602954 [Lentinus tigrinus ALCF2SS1-6]
MSASQYIDTMSTSQYIDSILFNLPPVPVPTFFAAIDHTGAVPPATYPLHAIPVQDAPLPALPAPLPTPMPAPMQVVEAPTTKPRRKDPRTYKRFTNPGRKPAAPGKGRRRLANPPSACEMDPAEDLWVSFEGESSTCKFGAKVCDYSDAPDKIWDHIKKKHWPELTGTSNAEKKVQCLWGNCRQRLTADSLKNHAPIPAYPEPEFSLMPAVPVAGAGLATGSAAGEDFVSALHAAEQFLLGDAPQVDAAEVDFSDMFANEPFSLA